MPPLHDPPEHETRTVCCPRCKKPSEIAAKTHSAEDFCQLPYRAAICDYPLFFVDDNDHDGEADDSDTASAYRPGDSLPDEQPSEPKPRAELVALPAKQSPVWGPPASKSPEPDRHWQFWPLVLVVAVVDIALLVYIVRELLTR